MTWTGPLRQEKLRSRIRNLPCNRNVARFLGDSFVDARRIVLRQVIDDSVEIVGDFGRNLDPCHGLTPTVDGPPVDGWSRRRPGARGNGASPTRARFVPFRRSQRIVDLPRQRGDCVPNRPQRLISRTCELSERLYIINGGHRGSLN